MNIADFINLLDGYFVKTEKKNKHSESGELKGSMAITSNQPIGGEIDSSTISTTDSRAFAVWYSPPNCRPRCGWQQSQCFWGRGWQPSAVQPSQPTCTCTGTFTSHACGVGVNPQTLLVVSFAWALHALCNDTHNAVAYTLHRHTGMLHMGSAGA